MIQCLEASAEVDAPLELVYAVVADVERYPEFVPNVEEVMREDDLYAMTVRLGPLRFSWTSRATLTPYSSIEVTLVQGPFERMDVRWAFASREGKTEVTYTTEFELSLPLPGIERIAAQAFEENARETVRAFRLRVEAMREGGV